MNFYDLYERLVETGTSKPVRVCFVCFGNTDRSPMTEAIAKHLLGGKAIVSSAGYRPDEGRPISDNSREVMKTMGIDASKHVSRHLTPEIIANNDLVIFLDKGVAGKFQEIVPKNKLMITPVRNPNKNKTEEYWDAAESIMGIIRRLVVPIVNRVYTLINTPKSSPLQGPSQPLKSKIPPKPPQSPKNS